MKKLLSLLCILASLLSGCGMNSNAEDLRSVPVTNNPHILPNTGETAQAPSFN